ncbi:TspO/MBR family protein [Nocardia sp. NPDC051832]|uniref:TspO/MBR family protein n=1 Tax=Nocardia sp. NPDC051832 TaxID=3155673 RepID=UPI00341A8F84
MTTALSRSSNLRTTAAWAGTAAVAGSLAAGPGSRWYQQLDKPSFQPPRAAFPLAWTLLYADIATTTALALDHTTDPARQRATRQALAANLVLNAAWTWVFFRAHRLGAATIVAAALTASGVALTRRVAAAHPSGRALALYPAWCAFATVLSASIWRRNRSR